MKKTILAAVSMIILSSTSAFADGFTCETLAGDLSVKVYNHLQPSAGTRNAAVMVISDQNVKYGRKTIARFTDVKETLINSAASYTAIVREDIADSARGGELILGTKLGYVMFITLDIDFQYGNALADGELTSGMLTLEKENGDDIQAEVVCTRYLKGARK